MFLVADARRRDPPAGQGTAGRAARPPQGHRVRPNAALGAGGRRYFGRPPARRHRLGAPGPLFATRRRHRRLLEDAGRRSLAGTLGRYPIPIESFSVRVTGWLNNGVVDSF